MRSRDFIKKYWLIMLLLTLCPVAVNYIVLTPSFLPIVGNADKWLSFFGSFIGSVIMAGITLYVLHKQLDQNQDENTRNRNNNKAENEANRLQSQKIRLQEIELRWYEDLKHACIKLNSAFDNNDVIILSDINPLSESFNDRTTQLIARMNEASFNFQLVINYHKNIANTAEVCKIQKFVNEYLALLSDMNYLHAYAVTLKDNLENIDITPDEFNSRCKNYILKHKKMMEIPEITANRVWDILSDNYDDLNYIHDILSILIKRIDNFKMQDVGNSLIELLKAEYKKATMIIN